VCCDHLAFVYQNAAQKNVLFNLNQEHGMKMINDVIDHSMINKCKQGCRKEYPVEMPQALPPVQRDPTLGTENNPAKSCIDIKIWGPYNFNKLDKIQRVVYTI
jgi:hypothetical protein